MWKTNQPIINCNAIYTFAYHEPRPTSDIVVAQCIDVIMTTMASQITSLIVVYSTVYSDADQRKHQSSASLTFVRGIPRTKDQLHGKCFHMMTLSCDDMVLIWQYNICNHHIDDVCWRITRLSQSNDTIYTNDSISSMTTSNGCIFHAVCCLYKITMFTRVWNFLQIHGHCSIYKSQ